METKEILKQVKKIELSTKNLVEGIITGKYRSIFKGQGLDFSEIREYRAGDDIRAIDWNVTARFNKPFIKEFVEERDLLVYFALDLSASGVFGSNISKKRKAIETTATLMFSAMKNNDNLGLFLFTDNVEMYIPARKGKKHLFKLLSRMISYNPESKQTDLRTSLKNISGIIKKRSIIFIISDFFSDDFLKPLKIMKNKHDIIALKITDPREKKIPDIGLIELEDEETGEQILVDTTDEEFRNNYQRLIQTNHRKLEKSLRKLKIDFIEILTDEPYIVPLQKFFKKRKSKVVR